MRQPTQDGNAGAVLQVPPAKQHAVRTAEVATHHNNEAQQKVASINALGSSLTNALSPYLEKEAENKNKARYMKAFIEPGSKSGRAEFLEDNRRTGITAALFGGQTPEYKGVLDASARAAADELYVEQANFIDGEGGDRSPTDYAAHSSTMLKAFLEDNFTESPDGAVAFMENWQERSNQLAKQHSKLNSIREQEKARRIFKDGWQASLSRAKTLAPQDSEAGLSVLNDLFDYSKVKTNMEYPAWSSATMEETLSVIGLGDTSIIPAFRGSDLFKDMTSKQATAYNKAINVIDSDNSDAVKFIGHQLDLAIDAATTPSELDRAFEAHVNSLTEISAKNTMTDKHMVNISGADVFRKNAFKTYSTQRATRLAEDLKYQKLDLKYNTAQYKYELSSLQGDENITDRINKHSSYLVNVLSTANDNTKSVELRIEALTQAKLAQEGLEAEGGNIESVLSSKANLLQSELSLTLQRAAVEGKPPEGVDRIVKDLELLKDTTKSDDTKALINNLLTNVSKSVDGDIQTRLDNISAEEVNDLTSINMENKIGLSTLESEPGKPLDKASKEVSYINDTIIDLQKSLEDPRLTAKGKVELQSQMLWWRNKLGTKQSESERLAAKQAEERRKLEVHTNTVNSIKAAYKDGGTVPNGTPKQRTQAANELVMDTLRSPSNADLTDEDLIDAALSDGVSTRRIIFNSDNVSSSLEIPVLKRGMDAVLRRLVTGDEEATSQSPWTEENKVAVQVLQTAYKDGGLLWNQLSSESQNRAIYLSSAILNNIDRATAMRIAETPTQVGFRPEPQEEGGWRGIVDKMKLTFASSNIQNRANGLYNYLAPKLGHQAAIDHTRDLVEHSHIQNDTLNIMYGKSFPTIEYSIENEDGTVGTSTTTLEDMSKGFSKFTTEIKEYKGLPGVTRVVSDSTANTLMQDLVGNSKRKDGTAITSFSEIDGFSAEVIGDTVVFHSNFGTTTLSKTKLGALASDLAKGNKRHEERLKQRRRRSGSAGSRLWDPSILQSTNSRP